MNTRINGFYESTRVAYSIRNDDKPAANLLEEDLKKLSAPNPKPLQAPKIKRLIRSHKKSFIAVGAAIAAIAGMLVLAYTKKSNDTSVKQCTANEGMPIESVYPDAIKFSSRGIPISMDVRISRSEFYCREGVKPDKFLETCDKISGYLVNRKVDDKKFKVCKKFRF